MNKRAMALPSILAVIAGCQTPQTVQRSGIEQPVVGPSPQRQQIRSAPPTAVAPPPALALPAPSPAPAAAEIAQMRQESFKRVEEFARFDEDFVRTNGEKKLLASAISAVRDSLKDPASAQVRGARIIRTPVGRVVCGEVNAKNSYGGYVGFTPFAASAVMAVVYHPEPAYPDIEEAFNAGIFRACLGK